ncbi:hypothetical protein TCAL_03107 [Tigriopus californicus]|uniref:Uncharacterized protein n=2 Tax=Tigriopus californicus TaxID=6832 RepID=A0A553NQQ4_TIGCA|nr:hypothetical protein TCAL_03107 [Tigriopus californicus]|eukprot:TCALIF_03107-PA protein Name:"Similar to resilin Pro-resilin (Drosophila melanogaster)" AED:0.33 eAED:0.33 QI:0/1/0.5/1/1/1/2/54/870
MGCTPFILSILAVSLTLGASEAQKRSDGRGVRFVSGGRQAVIPNQASIPEGTSYFVIQKNEGEGKSRSKPESHVSRRGASPLHVPPLGGYPSQPRRGPARPIYPQLGVPPPYPPPPPQPVFQTVPATQSERTPSYSELVLGSKDSNEDESEEDDSEEKPKRKRRKKNRRRRPGQKRNRRKKKKGNPSSKVYVIKTPVVAYRPFKQFTAPYHPPQHSFPVQSDYPGASYVTPDPNHYVSHHQVTPTPYPHGYDRPLQHYPQSYGPTPTPHPEPHYGPPPSPTPHYGPPPSPQIQHIPESKYGPSPTAKPHFGNVATSTISYSHGDSGSNSHSYFEFSTPKPHYQLAHSPTSPPPITFQEEDEQNFYHFQTFPVQSSGVLPDSSNRGGPDNFQGDQGVVSNSPENNNDGTFTIYTPPGLSITPVISSSGASTGTSNGSKGGSNGTRGKGRRKKNGRRNKGRRKNQKRKNQRRQKNNKNPNEEAPYSVSESKPFQASNEDRGDGDIGSEAIAPNLSSSTSVSLLPEQISPAEDKNEKESQSEVPALVEPTDNDSNEKDENKFEDNTFFQSFLGNSNSNSNSPTTSSSSSSLRKPKTFGFQPILKANTPKLRTNRRRKNRKNKSNNFPSFPDTTDISANLELTTLTPKLEIDVSAENSTDGSGDYEYEYQETDYEYGEYNTPPEESKYEYKYEVDNDKDQKFAHEESRDGENIEGSYHVDLPDGRRQTVKYVADESGFHAEVTYEGEAVILPANDKNSNKPGSVSSIPASSSYGAEPAVSNGSGGLNLPASRPVKKYGFVSKLDGIGPSESVTVNSLNDQTTDPDVKLGDEDQGSNLDYEGDDDEYEYTDEDDEYYYYYDDEDYEYYDDDEEDY